jgi:hypothetical protein
LRFNITATSPKGINYTDTFSLFLGTQQNAQKYNNVTFCEAIEMKGHEYINLAKQIVLDNNGNDNKDKTAQTNIENAKKYLTEYLTECGTLSQYSVQLGNTTEIFPELNMTGFAGVDGSSVTDGSNINIPSATDTSQAGAERGRAGETGTNTGETGTNTGETGTEDGGATEDEGTGKTEDSKEGQSGDAGTGGGGSESSSDVPSIDMPAEPGQDLTGGEKECGANYVFNPKIGECEPEIPG